MAEDDTQLQTNTYTWSQSDDQVTISFLVPESAKSRDVDITIERQYLKAGLKGEEPVFQAKLFQPVNHYESIWQLEKNSISPFSSITASPNFSAASSFAFMSSPNHSPPHSPNSSVILPPPATATATEDAIGMSEMSELLIPQQQQHPQQASTASPVMSDTTADDISSQPMSPTLIHTPPAIITPPHLQKPKYKILTIHLEKEEIMHWAVPIAGPHHKSPTMDVTSSYLLGQWFRERRGDLVKALEYFLSAAERGHTLSMLKAAELYEIDKNTTTATTYPEKDVKKAFDLYKQAADCSDQESGRLYSSGPDPLACYTVATIYASGSPEIDVEKDYQKALYYYNRCMTITAPRIDIDFSLLEMEHIPKSKLRSHPPHTQDERYFCNAAFQTGLIYLYGSAPAGEQVHSVTEVTADPSLALRYWKEAGILGYANACFNIGIVYLNGIGVTANEWVAKKWFGRAMKLDFTGNLKLPEGVVTVDWDLTKEQQQQQQCEESKKKKANSSEAKRKRRRRKVKQTKNPKNDGMVGAIVALGSIITVVGVAWFIYSKTKRSHQ